jgi:glutathione S-transferase
MKLYYSPGACSLSPHIVAKEAGIDLSYERVALGTKKTETDADYRTINPKGYVPALRLDDGQVLTEGPVIVQFLADQNPSSKLAPAAGSMERYRLQEWLTFINSELHKAYSPLFHPKTPPEQRASVIETLGKRFDVVEAALSGHPYLLGETFSVADAYLFTILNWSRIVSVDLSKWPNIVAFVQRVSDRPAVRAAMEEEGLIKKN